MGMSINHRVKGETALPTAALTLVSKVGVTRAAKEIGTSTTPLHKARKAGVISKPVELAAAHALEHLGDVNTARPRPPRPTMTKPKPSAASKPKDAMFLLAVTADKAEVVERFAEALGADIVSA